MGAALRLEEFVPDRKAMASLASVSLADIGPGRMSRDKRKDEEFIRGLSAALAEMRDGMARLVSEARSRHPENIEELIDQLLEWERGLDADFSSEFKAGEELPRLMKKVPRPYRTSVEPNLREALDILQEGKEAVRDARWQLIVVRADMLPKGEGPVFDNARELGQALDKLKA